MNVLIAQLVRARGFTAVTAQEAGQRGRSDSEQLAYAVRRQKTLLTHNRAHFEALAEQYFQARQTHSGIIIAVRRPAHDITARLLTILNTTTADEIENQVRYI